MENQTGKIVGKSFIRTFGTSLFTAFFIYILEIIFIVAFTALIYSGELSSQIPRALPSLMLVASVLFYALAWVMNISIAKLQAQGWLLDASLSTGTWGFALSPAIVSQVDWGLLFKQLPALIAVAIISVVALLLNSSGMELIVKKDIDLNRELITAGIGNLAAGLAGGLVGF
jgi:SulP family sulfate permease